MIHCEFGNGDVVYGSDPHHDFIPLVDVRNFPTFKKKNSTYDGLLPIYLKVLAAFL